MIVKTTCGPFVTLDNSRKISKNFSSLQSLPFSFQKIVFPKPLRSRRNGVITRTMIARRPWIPPRKNPWGFPYSIVRDSAVKEVFSLERLPLFQKSVLSTTSQVLQKWLYYFHSHCQNTLWTLIKCFLRFDILDNTRKLVQKLLFTGKFAFFSEFCVVNNLLGVTENFFQLSK